MRTVSTAVAMATVLGTPTAAKILMKNPQRLLPDASVLTATVRIRRYDRAQSRYNRVTRLARGSW